MIEKHEFREQFLKEFVKQLSMQYYIIKNTRTQIIKAPEKVEPQIVEKIVEPLERISINPIKIKIMEMSESPVPSNVPIEKAMPIPSPQFPKFTPINPLEKLELLLKDSSVELIECHGPDKNLIVKKQGSIMETKILMKEEEIKSMIAELSKITKVPLVNGVFRGTYGKLAITAISSEYVGSRFVIQKMP